MLEKIHQAYKRKNSSGMKNTKLEDKGHSLAASGNLSISVLVVHEVLVIISSLRGW